MGGRVTIEKLPGPWAKRFDKWMPRFLAAYIIIAAYGQAREAGFLSDFFGYPIVDEAEAGEELNLPPQPPVDQVFFYQLIRWHDCQAGVVCYSVNGSPLDCVGESESSWLREECNG